MCKSCGCSFRSRDFGNVERFVEPCILLLLFQTSSHGYELLQNLKQHCRHEVDIGNLYRTLRRMEKDGWVQSDWKEGSGVPDRRIYSITPDGKEVLHDTVLSLEKTDELLHLLFDRYKKITQKP